MNDGWEFFFEKCCFSIGFNNFFGGWAGWLAGLAGWLSGWLAGWPGGIGRLKEPNVDFSLVLATFLLAGLALGALAGWAGWLACSLAG